MSWKCATEMHAITQTGEPDTLFPVGPGLGLGLYLLGFSYTKSPALLKQLNLRTYSIILVNLILFYPVPWKGCFKWNIYFRSRNATLLPTWQIVCLFMLCSKQIVDRRQLIKTNSPHLTRSVRSSYLKIHYILLLQYALFSSFCNFFSFLLSDLINLPQEMSVPSNLCAM